MQVIYIYIDIPVKNRHTYSYNLVHTYIYDTEDLILQYLHTYIYIHIHQKYIYIRNTYTSEIHIHQKSLECCTTATHFICIFFSLIFGLWVFCIADCYFSQKAWRAQNAGAAAILVADDRDEPLITMDSPTDDTSAEQYLQNITIPSALIEKSLGDKLKLAFRNKQAISCKLDWTESVPHPDDRVEYELWTNSNDECGPRCESQKEFVKSFRGAAQLLEEGGYTLFSPHYITWYCPEAFITSRQCISQCINKGRYCSPDPEQDFESGYDGKDVVTENLRQLCVYRVANETLRRPWVWWDYVTDFQIRCPMSEKKYNQECAEQVITSLGVCHPHTYRETFMSNVYVCSYHIYTWKGSP